MKYQTITPKKNAFTFIILALFASFITNTAHANEITFDRWYSLRLLGKPAGWAHSLETRDEQQIISISKTFFTLKRGPVDITISVTTRFVETLDGRPIESQISQKLSSLEINQHLQFTDQGVELTIKQAGQTQHQTLATPKGNWLTPAAAQRYAQQEIALGKKKIKITMLDPTSGIKPITTYMKKIGQEKITTMGKTLLAEVWDITLSQMPGIVVRTYRDQQGREIKTSMTPMPGLTFEMIQTDQQLAQTKIDPPEILLQTFIYPNKTIAHPRTARRLAYQLTISPDKQGQPKFNPNILKTTASQTVTPLGKNQFKVVIDMDNPVKAAKPNDRFLAATAMLNYHDPKVKQLADKALLPVKNSSKMIQAEQLRQFVHQYISEKSLAVGFATASEVARTAEGDCSEHGVLLAALLRAAKIPSRVVSGLIYAENFLGKQSIFGYHMWAQAWLTNAKNEGHWVDLDAVLGPENPSDATHLILSYSDMANANQLNDMIQMIPVIGRLSIDIIETAP